MAEQARNRILGLLAAIVFLCYAGFLYNQDKYVDHSGWKQLSTGLGYRNFSGEFVTGWQEIDGEYYHFGENYALQIGWLEQDGNKYYLHTDGKRAEGWQEIDSNRYLFDENGILQIEFYGKDDLQALANAVAVQE